jgi:hypothetical protein
LSIERNANPGVPNERHGSAQEIVPRVDPNPSTGGIPNGIVDEIAYDLHDFFARRNTTTEFAGLSITERRVRFDQGAGSKPSSARSRPDTSKFARRTTMALGSESLRAIQ